MTQEPSRRATADHPDPPRDPASDKSHGPKYTINIEGQDYLWNSDTITVPEIRELAGIPSDQPIQEINLETQEERTLAEEEVVALKPGKGFSKKVKFQRG
jgi:hypothetical protein